MRDYIFGGNWKMQINSFGEAKRRLTEMASSFPADLKRTRAFVAPPFPFLRMASEILKDSELKLGAQNVGHIEQGALTGEVSIQTLKELSVEYVIVGHSERRLILGESNQIINKKVTLLLENGMTPVLCVGETAEERSKGKSIGVIYDQLLEGLKGINDIEGLIIAYEPVWAINNRLLNPVGEIVPASVKEAKAAHHSIRDWLVSRYGEVGEKVPLLYGGSMNSSNAKDLLAVENINGGLIGSASLSAEQFLPLLKLVSP